MHKPMRPAGNKEGVVETMPIASDTALDDELTTTEPATDTAISAERSICSFARDNALALGLGAFAIGVAAGVLAALFLPRTRIVVVRMTPLAGEIAHKALETGEKVVMRGEQMAKESLVGLKGIPMLHR